MKGVTAGDEPEHLGERRMRTESRAKNLTAYLLRSSWPETEFSDSIARVSVAWMATVKSQGWVYTSLEMEALSSVIRNWITGKIVSGKHHGQSRLTSTGTAVSTRRMRGPRLTGVKLQACSFSTS